VEVILQVVRELPQLRSYLPGYHFFYFSHRQVLMAGAYHRALPYTNSLKKGWEGVNIFLVWMVHRVTFKGEDYIIDA
jgi:hypothetical protein